MKFPRNAKILRSHFDVAPFAAVFFLLLIFLLFGTLIPTAGIPLHPPTAIGLPGVDAPSVDVAVDANGNLYFKNQMVTERVLVNGLRVGHQRGARAADAHYSCGQIHELRHAGAFDDAGARLWHHQYGAGHPAPRGSRRPTMSDLSADSPACCRRPAKAGSPGPKPPDEGDGRGEVLFCAGLRARIPRGADFFVRVPKTGHAPASR